MKLTRSAAAIGAAVMLAGAAAAGCGSGGGSSSAGAAVPAKLTVWRMGASVPSQVTWMKGVVTQFHKKYPQFAKTKVNVVWVPWTVRTTDWNDALSSGKNAPDVTELGNTDTPTEAGLGVVANISSFVNGWSSKPGIVAGMLANDIQNGNYYAVPWFGGVRAIWYRTDQFKRAGISSPPASWADLVADAQKLEKTFPGTSGIDAITDDTNAFASFVWGAGGTLATENHGTWTADLTSPADEAAIKFYVSLYRTYHLSPSKYIGQTELGNTGSTAGGANTDFGLGKLDLYIDGPWATATMPANSTDKSNWASFPIPSENGTSPAPAFAGGSDLGIFATSKYKQADWDLISVMDNTPNSTSFAKLAGFFPPYSAAISGGIYAGQPFMTGFATAALHGRTVPLNAKNWPTADTGKYFIIPNMLKALMNGAPFQSTVATANSQLQTVLNTGSES